jgi:hypothetical protein
MTTDTPTTTIPRLDNESSRAHEARRIYVEMGPQRSLDKVGQYLGHKGASGIVTRWSRQYDWAATARAWDDQQAAMASMRASAEYQEHLAKQRDDAMNYGIALCNVALQMLNQLKAVQKDIDYTPAALATIAKALTTGLDLRAHALDLERVIPTLSEGRDDG